jgi:hypothetical protein
MSSSYEGMLVVKLCCVEGSIRGTAGEVEALCNRIAKVELSPPPFMRRADGLAVDAKYCAAAKRWIKHPDINREGEEIFLDVDPFWAHFPSY